MKTPNLLPSHGPTACHRLGVRWQSEAATPLWREPAAPAQPERRGASLPAALQARRLKRSVAFSVCLALLLVSFQGNSGSIVGSAHDLSSGSTTEVCVFCHTPHHANGSVQGPLWNRFVDPNTTFTLYASPTMNTLVPQPSPVSRLCLGCHDGVNATATANGFSGSTKHDVANPPVGPRPDQTTWPSCNGCHADIVHGRPPKMLGTQLHDDHPISMTYPTPAQDDKFYLPPDLQNGWGTGNVRLRQGKVECVSCHDVHKPDYAPFLVKPNTGSALCITCHKM